MCPFNLEINEKQMVSLTAALKPALILYHKDIDVAAMVGDAPAERVRFGAWSPDGAKDPQDELFVALPRGDAAHLPERNDADDTACIFCTSGTTARPKIVIYNHAAYWMNGLDTLEFLGLTEDDRTLEYRSFGWNSAQVLSLLPFLQKGLTMHIAKRFSHSHFFEWVQQHGITFSAGVPTVLNILLNKPIGYTAKDIPTLRLMSCSTAPLTAQQWLQFEEMYGVTLLQMYGMSETGWICGNRHYAKKMGTVGLPALHQELIIVDADGNECPPDVEGEITVGGPQMAIGYLLDDGSIDPVLGKRIKTGDLGIKDAEGFVRVSGRSKDLIIRGGVNIAPLEIDEIMLKHPGVAEAAAVGVPDKIYGEEVVCYVVPKDKALTEADGAGARRQIPAAGQDAEAGADRARPAEERPRQGAARQAARRLDRAAESPRSTKRLHALAIPCVERAIPALTPPPPPVGDELRQIFLPQLHVQPIKPLELRLRERMRRGPLHQRLGPRLHAREFLDQAERLDAVEVVIALQERRIGRIDQRIFRAVEERPAAGSASSARPRASRTPAGFSRCPPCTRPRPPHRPAPSPSRRTSAGSRSRRG